MKNKMLHKIVHCKACAPKSILTQVTESVSLVVTRVCPMFTSSLVLCEGCQLPAPPISVLFGDLASMWP